MPNSAQDAARQVRVTRITRGWSQAELADRAHVARNSVGALEAGRPVSPNTTAAVLAALGIGDDTTTPKGPAVEDATDAQLMAELAHRLANRMPPA